MDEQSEDRLFGVILAFCCAALLAAVMAAVAMSAPIPPPVSRPAVVFETALIRTEGAGSGSGWDVEMRKGGDYAARSNFAYGEVAHFCGSWKVEGNVLTIRERHVSYAPGSETTFIFKWDGRRRHWAGAGMVLQERAKEAR